MMDGGVWAMSAVIFGLFGQVAFYADIGRDLVPAWLRVALHLTLVLPLVFIGPPSAGRGGRALQAGAVTLGTLYLGVSLASLVLVLAGVRMPGLAFYLVLEAIGAVPVALVTAQAARFLRGPGKPPPEPLFQPPWAGAYRTRPFVSPAPQPPAARPPRPDRGPLGHAFLCTVLAAAGALLAGTSHHGSGHFWGLVNLVFFGPGAWLLWEQVAAGAPGSQLPRTAQYRMLVVMFFAGLAEVYVGITAEAPDVSGLHRCLVAGSGALLALVSVWRIWKPRRSPP
jgi:hypothetical protein